jgi:dCTP deaminase
MIRDHNRLAPSAQVAMEPVDMLTENPVRRLIIPDDGLVIYPGMLYLGKTIEFTETHNFVPCIEGRSSIGRLGISIHATASLGNSGFAGSFVLEISCVQPVRIYPNIEVCQIYYQDIKGEIMDYNGRYQSQDDIVPSKLYL